jgi:glycosyltransferase involved in cell wall biosynthesis
MSKLSVILITLNEADNILAVLQSVRFANEWIVVDSGSTDDTVERARRWGASVYVHSDWHGFGQQKNRALSYATGEWVLSLDADERVTPPLAAEIQRVIGEGTDADGYTMPRLSSYCGHFLRHGDWWPDRVLRLFRRERGRFSNHMVHESVCVDGIVRRLAAHLIHYSYPTAESVIDKMNAYSTAGAISMCRQSVRGGVVRGVLHGMWKFLRGYVFRGGFLDGRYGFLAAVSNAEHTYYRYAKRWLIDQSASKLTANRSAVLPEANCPNSGHYARTPTERNHT